MQTDDETLMALADGEITGPQADVLRARIADDALLAARFAMFVETAAVVRQASGQDPDARVSDDLVQRIRAAGEANAKAEIGSSRTADVVPIRRASALDWRPLALAASLALAVGIGAGMFVSKSPVASDNPVLSAEVIAHLDSTPSGREATLGHGGRLTVVSSFRDAAGQFCREYDTVPPEAAGYVAVACRGASVWDLRFAMAKGGATEGYAPASSLEALDAFYSATGAGEPMPLEEELAHLR